MFGRFWVFVSSRPWPSWWRRRGFRRWQWPWGFLFVLYLAAEDGYYCFEVVGLVAGRAFFVVVVIRNVVENGFAAVVDRFCPVRWRR